MIDNCAISSLTFGFGGSEGAADVACAEELITVGV